MTLTLSVPEQDGLKPKLTVFGVGGAGGNAVNNMIEKSLEGVEFVSAKTDAQALQQSLAKSKIQLGISVTEGLGAGAIASVGASAAEESLDEIVEHLVGSHMCFIAAGMGGGTGSGASPIIAQAARKLGILTVGVVTKPFEFEGFKRMRQAEEGVMALQQHVDTLIIIPNQNLFRIANEKTAFTEAFSMADDVLYQGVKGVTDLMVRPGLINLDFADVRAVMDEMGKAMMGTGEAEGEDRAVNAAERAIANPLLDEISLQGANGVLINVTGSHDMTLFELDEAANRIRKEVDKNANIIVGSTLDVSIEGRIRVSVVATGIDAADMAELPQRHRGFEEEEPLAADDSTSTDAEGTYGATGLEAVPTPDSEYEQGEAEGDDGRGHFPAPFGDDLSDDQQVAGSSRFGQEPSLEPLPDREPSFAVAPSPPIGGALSEEQLSRLHLAAQNRGVEEPTPISPAPVLAPKERKRGFRITSLISKMTGHASDTPESDHTVEQTGSGTVPSDTTTVVDTDQNRVEIPAFLRRQAN